MLMPELESVVLEAQQVRAKLLLRAMADWFKSAGSREPTQHARAFLAALDGVALHYLFVYERYPLRAMKRHLLGIGLRLCGASE